MLHEIRLPIKPLSINKAYTGRRFKTPEYKVFLEACSWLLLEKKREKITGWVNLNLKFFLKNFKRSDTSNNIKIIEDILVKNDVIDDDRFVKKVIAEKFKVDDEKDERIIIKITKF